MVLRYTIGQEKNGWKMKQTSMPASLDAENTNRVNFDKRTLNQSLGGSSCIHPHQREQIPPTLSILCVDLHKTHEYYYFDWPKMFLPLHMFKAKHWTVKYVWWNLSTYSLEADFDANFVRCGLSTAWFIIYISANIYKQKGKQLKQQITSNLICIFYTWGVSRHYLIVFKYTSVRCYPSGSSRWMALIRREFVIIFW